MIPRPLKIGIGGPVGSGKTALAEALCLRLRDRVDMAVITNDIYTREDAEFPCAAARCRASGSSAWRPAVALTPRSVRTPR